MENLVGNISNKNSISGVINKGVEYLDPITQEKSVTPTRQEQEVVYDEGYTGLSKVTVNSIPDEYIIPSGNLDITINDVFDVTPFSQVTTNVINIQKVEVPDGTRFTGSRWTDSSVDFLENLDFSNITNFESMFSNITTITRFPNVDLSNGEIFNSTFYSCNTLANMPTLSYPKATDMSSMFYNCAKLTSVGLLNTSKVTQFFNTFTNCVTLETVNSIDTSGATSTQQMFSYCYKLKNLPTLDMTKNKSAQSMFQYCSELVNAPNIINGGEVNYLNRMFRDCTALENVPLYSFPKAWNVQYMFLNCPNLTDESLNNIMAMLTPMTSIGAGSKTLSNTGLTSEQATRCQSLSNYQAFVNAGWSTGY